MELKQYFAVLKRWAWLILLSTGLAAGISYQVSASLPHVYSATTTLMVGTLLQSANPNGADFSTTQQLAQTYVLLVKREPLLQATVDSLGYQMSWQALAGQINATALPQTQLLQITAVDSSPQRARAIADEVAHQLVLQSPTPAEQQQDKQQEFITTQLAQLQARISDSEDQLTALQTQLALENTALGVQDAQSQITALQQKIATWQGTYANLLNNKVGRTNTLNVVESASLPTSPVSPNTTITVGTAALGGLVFALAAILLLEYIDDTIKTRQDVERILNLPTLAIVSRARELKEPVDALIKTWQDGSRVAEAYRMLRINLEFTSLRHAVKTIVVTSATVGEGKSTTASNLAITMALAGKQVILVDADLRRPAVHRIFGYSHEVGLTSLLLDEHMATDDVLLDTPVPGLTLLLSGRMPPNPSELLGSEPMRERLQELRAMADVVIIDTPAVLPLSDAPILATQCDGVVMVVDARRTRSDTARQAKANLALVGVKFLGVVLNKGRLGRAVGAEYYRVGRAGSRRKWAWVSALWN
jgi:non-specific protein-tyrosine kinase